MKYRRSGVHIIPFSIPFGIDKFERKGGKFLLNDNLNKKNWGHFYLIGCIFFKLGANVLMEFENAF